MRLLLDNLYCKVTEIHPVEERWLIGYLSYTDPDKFGKKDNTSSLYDVVLQRFPTGLLSMVRNAAKQQGFHGKIVDARVQPCRPDPNVQLDWTRDYQDEAVEWGVTKGRGIFWMPTGSGKSATMSALSMVLPCRWLITVHRASLLRQLAASYERFSHEKAGIIGDDVWDVRRVTVGMYQTLHNDLRQAHPKFPWLSIQGWHPDEVHTVASSTFYEVAMAMPNAYFRFGWSATPLSRGDKRNLLVVAVTGPVIHRIRADKLIGEGVLAKPAIRMVPMQQYCTGWKWNDVYDNLIVKSQRRNAAVVALLKIIAKPCIVFVVNLDHGYALEKASRRAGFSTEFVFGAKATAQREAAIRRLAHGDTDVLIASVVFQEGVDIPELRSIINASAGKSTIRCLQNLGRGTRRHDRFGRETKSVFEVYDFDDQGCGCQFTNPCDGTVHYKHLACKWMEKHTAERREAYISEGYEILPV